MDVPPLVLDRESPLPIYRQVQTWLRDLISTGVLPPGAMLPPVKLLCDRLGGINHQTVRQAINLLVQEGTLLSVPGRGAIVASQAERSVKIALVLPNLACELTLQIAQGVQSVFDAEVIPVEGAGSLRREKASVVIFDSRHSIQKEIENIAHLEDLSLDGAIILPVVYGDIVKHLVRLQSNDFPVVLVDCLVPGLTFPSVMADNYGGCYAATKHLLERGRRKLAWIGPSPVTFSSAAQRFEGFRDAIADFDLPFARKLVFHLEAAMPNDSLDSLVEDIVRKLASAAGEGLDGIVCDNDGIAFTTLQVLQERGVKVPQDVAVVGFDDLQEAKTSQPPLTTVHQPIFEMGASAARLILSCILNKEFSSSGVTLPVELVVRQSS